MRAQLEMAYANTLRELLAMSPKKYDAFGCVLLYGIQGVLVSLEPFNDLVGQLEKPGPGCDIHR